MKTKIQVALAVLLAFCSYAIYGAEKNKGLWTKPVITKFHFKLAGVKLTEVTQPAPEPK